MARRLGGWVLGFAIAVASLGAGPGWAQLSLAPEGDAGGGAQPVSAPEREREAVDRPAVLLDLRLGDHGDRTRLVLELSRALDYHLFSAEGADGPSLVLDLPRIGFERFLGARDGLGLIETIRGGPRRDGGGRMVLEVGRPVGVETVFYIPPRDGFGTRLVIDIVPAPAEDFALLARHTLGNPAISLGGADRTGADIPVASQPVRLDAPRSDGPQPAVPAPDPIAATAPPIPLPDTAGETPSAPISVAQAAIPVPPPAPPIRPEAGSTPVTPAAAPGIPIPGDAAASTVPPPSAAMTASLGLLPMPPRRPAVDWPVVTIDPGHGGVDPGAISIGGVFEKSITLAVGRRLAERLSQTGRIQVRLTREDDRFLALRERVALARGWGSDLFISVHADSIDDANVRGASVYTLSDVASDAEAAALARRENRVDAIAGVEIDPEDDVMTSILIDLAQQSTFRESHRFAGDVIAALDGSVPLLPNTHRQAGFAVLKAPDVPSVLVELGYLSSQRDAQMLTDATHQDLLAERLAAAVIAHFEAVGRLDLAEPQAASLSPGE